MEAAVEQPVFGLEVLRKDNNLFDDDKIQDENLNNFGEGSSRYTLAEVRSGSGQKRIFADVSMLPLHSKIRGTLCSSSEEGVVAAVKTTGLSLLIWTLFNSLVVQAYLRFCES